LKKSLEHYSRTLKKCTVYSNSSGWILFNISSIILTVTYQGDI
jgi:hypothetical protein